jgi:hypothetical protein
MRIPEEPAGSPRATASIPLRYEDVTQDGRLVLDAMPTALGETIWRQLLQKHPMARAMREQGILPILSRVIVLGGEGPISVNRPIEAEGTFELGHTVDAEGEVDRILLCMWVTLRGPVGRTHGGKQEGDGRTIELGRVFAEHVFTRPFAEPTQRKVLTLSIDGGPAVPERRYEARRAAEIAEVPLEAEPLDVALSLDPAPIVFGLDHTDSNQHVNSLVYPRVFVEAALRRLHGQSKAPLMARGIEIAYRKPCFAGERLHVALRAYEEGGGYGVVGVLVGDEDAAKPLESARPRCFVRLALGR